MPGTTLLLKNSSGFDSRSSSHEPEGFRGTVKSETSGTRKEVTCVDLILTDPPSLLFVKRLESTEVPPTSGTGSSRPLRLGTSEVTPKGDRNEFERLEREPPCIWCPYLRTGVTRTGIRMGGRVPSVVCSCTTVGFLSRGKKKPPHSRDCGGTNTDVNKLSHLLTPIIVGGTFVSPGAPDSVPSLSQVFVDVSLTSVVQSECDSVPSSKFQFQLPKLLFLLSRRPSV